MQRNLKKEELYLVKPKFHSMVIATWSRGEEVPFEVVNLKDDLITNESEAKEAFTLLLG